MLIPIQTSFPSYTTLDQILGVQDAIQQTNDFNSTGLRWIADFKTQWNNTWSPNQTAARLQARLDTLATNVFNDLVNSPTNAWAQIYTESLAAFAFLYGLNASAFSDAIADPAGQNDPVTQTVYTRFKTAGWYYVIDGSKPCGIAVTTPIDFGN